MSFTHILPGLSSPREIRYQEALARRERLTTGILSHKGAFLPSSLLAKAKADPSELRHSWGVRAEDDSLDSLIQKFVAQAEENAKRQEKALDSGPSKKTARAPTMILPSLQAPLQTNRPAKPEKGLKDKKRRRIPNA